jgi:N-formylglutamate amidohydrolase
VIDAAEAYLRERGYLVRRNDPYAGGYTTRHYGRPADGSHALQIEINRSLYMAEDAIRRNDYFPTLAGDMGTLVGILGQVMLDATA